MATGWSRAGPLPVHPLHAILLGFPIALFTTGLVTDIAYWRTAQIQWTNFSAWLIVGALVTGGLVALWAVVDLILAARRRGLGRGWIYVAVLVLMLVLGLINAFQHSRDGWSSVGVMGLTLSALCTLLALAAGWIAYSGILKSEYAR